MNYFVFKSRARALDYSMNDEDKEFFSFFFFTNKTTVNSKSMN